MKCTSALYDVDKRLGCVYQRCSTIDTKDHSAIREEEPNNRTELNADEWFGVKPFSAFRGIMHVVQAIMGLFRCVHRCRGRIIAFKINRFFTDDLLKVGSAK